MTNKYYIVVDCKNGSVNSCYAKTLKSAKTKITKFIKNCPYSIESAIVYENHIEVFRK